MPDITKKGSRMRIEFVENKGKRAVNNMVPVVP